MPSSLRRPAAVALVAYAAVLAVVLLAPSSSVPNGLVRAGTSLGNGVGLPAALLAHGRVELGLNILAFAPLTFLGSVLRPSVTVSTWTAVAFGGSLLVETIQSLMPDRWATCSDVVANTVGAALGALLAWTWGRTQDQNAGLEGRAGRG